MSGGASLNVRADAAGLYGKVSALGFSTRISLSSADPLGELQAKLGSKPRSVKISDRQVVPEGMESVLISGAEQVIPYRYPCRI